MKVFSSRTAPEITGLLQQGAIGVIRTDTLYGTVASALLQPSVERVYQLRDRTPSKPMIILAASVADISDLVRLDGVEERLREFWPGPNSIILPALPKTP
ncbi:hypothetical protein CYG49_00115, partial [Candidatus Saccharibacteria bacterium]